MKSLTYISDNGVIIQFNKMFPYYLTFADLNSCGANFDEVVPVGYDGAITQGGNYSKKIIPAEGTLVGKSYQDLEMMRSKLSMAMNIHYEGTLIVELYSGKKKKIRCRPNKNPDFPPTFGFGQPFVLEWQCDNPYWTDYQETIVPIGQIIPTWSFPFTPPVQFGYAVSNATIMNNTCIEIPLRIEVLSQATAIEIKNLSNNQSFRVNQLIGKDYKLIIDGLNCDIDLVNLLTGEKVDATNKLVAGSDFITLSPGENRIELNNGIADSTPLSYIIYNDNPSLAV